MEIVIVLIAGAAIYWFFILRPGRLDFWRVVAKHPDAAYEHFKSDHCWRVFEEQLLLNCNDTRYIVCCGAWHERRPQSVVVPRTGKS